MKGTALTVALLGDVALNGLFNKEPEKNRDRFKEVGELLQMTDLVFANLETPVWGDGTLHHDKKDRMGVLLYSGREVVEEVLPILNISAVSLANNHVYDCMEKGLENTVHCLEALGVMFTGAGCGPALPGPVKIEKNGQVIGFLAYVHESTHPLTGSETGLHINLYNEEAIIAAISELKKACDHVILSLHWGVDYSFYPTRYQREAARRFIDAGADIILGHHPHTVQPHEVYNDRFIFYSLGSFCFGDFVYEGKLRSLKRKTKKTVLPIIGLEPDRAPYMVACPSLKELPGNRVTVRKRSLDRFLATKRLMMTLKHRFKAVDFFTNLKEAFIDRGIEYFFGYYRDPFKQLFDLKNLKKLRYSLRDYKQRRL